MNHRLLTEKEVAEITSISQATLRSHRFYRKGIPFIKIEGSVRYRESDVNDYLKENTVSFNVKVA